MDRPIFVESAVPRPLAPSEEDMRVIKGFSEDAAEREAFRKAIATAMAEALNDPLSTAKIIQSVVNDINFRFGTFERIFLGNSLKKHHIYYSDAFVRSFGFVNSAEEFVLSSINMHGPCFNDELPSSTTAESHSFSEFFLFAFWEEIKIYQRITAPSSLNEALLIIGEKAEQLTLHGRGRRIPRVNSLEDTKSSAPVKNLVPTHTFSWREVGGLIPLLPYQYQYIAHITPGMLNSFANSFRHEGLHYFLDEGCGVLLGIFPYDVFISARRDIYSKKLARFVGLFCSFWDRSRFFQQINADPATYNSKLIENALYNAIIRGSLNQEETGGDKTGRDGDDAPRPGPPISAKPFRERLAALDEFAATHSGQPVSSYLLKFFPELLELEAGERPALPEVAPAKWPEERIAVKGVLETPPEFIKRAYGEWEGRGLSKKLIRQLDEPLYRSLYSWLRSHEMPEWLDLPTVSQVNDRSLTRFGQGAPEGEFAAKEMRRLASAAQRRHQKS